MALDNVDLPEILIDDKFLFGIHFFPSLWILNIFSLDKYKILIAGFKTIVIEMKCKILGFLFVFVFLKIFVPLKEG